MQHLVDVYMTLFPIVQVGSHCQPLAWPDGQRDQELLELVDQEEDPQAGSEHDELVGDDDVEPSTQHGGVGCGGGAWPPADTVQQRGGAPARRHHQPEPSAAAEAGRRPSRLPAGAAASALPLLHVRHQRERQPAVVADVAGGAAANPVPHLHGGGDGRAGLPAASPWSTASAWAWQPWTAA